MLKVDRSSDVNLESMENIPYILVTLEVSKGQINSVSYLQLINICQTIIPILCDSNHTGSFGILKIIYLSTVISRIVVHTGTTNPRKFYPGEVLPGLILLAIIDTDVIAVIIAPSIIPGIHFLNLIAHIPPVIFR